ncbi:MAG: hypothetical protein F4X69_15770 [Gemmatimonadetes bacterium]|nr:hypothetical protein [Gemmatimonadota bacterium]
MDAEEARKELEIATHRVLGLHGAVQRAVDELASAKAAHRDNIQYRKYHSLYGDDFVERFQVSFNHVKKECAEAESKLDKAKFNYKEVTGLEPY